ncbi:glycosyl transferase [Shewanella sp. SNU WT4]|uniref:M66 family metalloprotease n=1 Tax=Shewanella sp. SNU WT4 TaxID=2590015 RepID=UPI001126B1D2|nr:M66 family metalloprotease [Shewanella sp. SNU WT4]QDF66645.1 glycosyl transferase [Shewanella sp. SNU WT4]
MFKTRFSPLALVIASALVPLAAQAEVTMQQAAEQTFSVIKAMKQRGEANDGVIVDGNKRFIVYNDYRFELHDDNYPKFPFPYGGEEALAPYYAAFPFLNDKWDIVMNNNYGFYFIHDDFGSMSSDTQGCFVEYFPEPSFSEDKIMRFEKTECISAPMITDFALSGIFDIGATATWQGHVEGNHYQLSLSSPSTKTQMFNATAPEFYLGNLSPNTDYQLALEACNTTGCVAVEPITLTTKTSQAGFHDGIRHLNHLDGEIAAHVSLMQSHSLTAPFGNDELNAPDVVINRAAMLLVTPELNDINQLWVEVYFEGELIAREIMQSPANQPKTDQYAVDGRPMVIFDHDVWSLPLQWNWMTPGLSLKFIDNHGRSSELAQHSITFGGAPELVIQNIDMGMLTKPRGRNTMANNTAEHASDYFQKIPVSKLVMGQYAPAHFETVTMPNGKVYTERSDTDGGWHSGDMREAIGKALISTGINNANVGITTSGGYSQAYNRRFNQLTAHTNVGVYTHPDNGSNKTVVHGGSGGGGILTLEATTGNEWSHEVGHNFGRSHYPSMASVHDMQSGWGWDQVFNRFIGNIDWRGAPAISSAGGETSLPYLETFRFLHDAQAGGEKQKIGLVSNFTLEHPTQARRTQAWLNSGFNQTPDGNYHYATWDQAQQTYVEANTTAPAPVKTGIPVTTLVGIYDPLGVNPSQIYPVLYGNYGNVFDLAPATDFEAPALSPGWHQYQSLSAEHLAMSTWKTIVDNGSHQRLCQFAFTTTNNTTVNLVGHVEPNSNTCHASDDMRWNLGGTWQQMESSAGDYSLLFPYGKGQITYSPTPEIGEVNLCQLTDINNPSHNGAGFVQEGSCVQIAGIKHSNNRDWKYAVRSAEQANYIHTSVCRLDVTTRQGQSISYDLASTRLHANQSNKFHINLPQQELSNVTLSCQDAEGVTILDSLTPSITTGIEDLPQAVIIGQEHGYQVLDSAIGQGWFDHTQAMDLDNLSKRDRNVLATMRVRDQQLPLCRFDLAINGKVETVHGFVEQLVTNDYRCTGGDDISLVQAGKEQRLESPINQFQWLSLWNPEHTGERVPAKNSNENLCSVKIDSFYGAGFINAGNQCVQIKGIKWSNGNDWVFTNNHSQYNYR